MYECHELCGAIHLHTSYSDGGVDLPELVAAARSVGLDYVIITDHMTLVGRAEEGFSGTCAVMVGYEHNDIHNRNHYLALGTTCVASSSASVQEYIDQIQADHGLGFIAHPCEKRNYFEKLPPYPWTQWDATGFTGIELWNQTSDWVEGLKSLRSFIRILFPRRFMANVNAELLARWDTLSKTRFVTGIGGVDAHTRKIGFGLISIAIFPIKVELKGIRTHVFLDNALPASFAEAQTLIYNALRNGNCCISNYRRGNAHGMRIWAEGADGVCCGVGQGTSVPQFPVVVHVRLPEAGEIYLVRNGSRIASCTGTVAAFDIATGGLYRIEVYKGKYAWIYSNHIPLGSYPFV